MTQRKRLCLLLAVLTLFVVWTYRPPHLPLFCDPVTGRYGIQ